MKKSSLLLLLLAGLIGSALSGSAHELLEEIIEQNYPVEPTAKFTLKNEEGSVLIYGADKPEMKLQAIKRAYTKDRLSKIDVNVSVDHDVIAINTKYPPKPRWGLSDRSGTVDYIIILPWYCELQRVELGNGEMLIEGMRGHEVHAQLGTGRLFGHNCFTDLHLSINGGGLDVAYDWWELHRIALETNMAHANMRLFIPGEAQFRLHAEAVNGHIFNDFPSKEDHRPGGQTKLDLSIGSGPNAEMNIHAVDGSIRIRESFP